MEDLIKNLSTKTDKQLVEILEFEKENFNVDAIKAVRQILKERFVSEEKYQTLLNDIKKEKSAEEEKKAIQKKQIDVVKMKAEGALNTIDPTIEKKDWTVLKILGFLFILYAGYNISQNYYSVLPEYIGWYSLEFILITGLLLLGGLGLVFQKSKAWYFINLALPAMLVMAVALQFDMIWMDAKIEELNDQLGWNESPKTRVVYILVYLIVLGGIIGFMNKKKTLSTLGISRMSATVTILISTMVGLGVVFYLKMIY